MAALLSACGRHASFEPWLNGHVDVLVLAPHPDDELLMAGGVIRSALTSGRSVAVAVVTNGDLNGFLCLGHFRNGLERQKESVDALSALGLPEENVFFLGYPDGGLHKLRHRHPLSTWRIDESGLCTLGDTTYGLFGAGSRDAHSVWHSTPAPYTSDALVGDLGELLTRLRPSDIYVSHPGDAHPDHHFTYVYLRRALSNLLEKAGPEDYPLRGTPTLHSALIHTGRHCWPSMASDGTCIRVDFPARPGIQTALSYPPGVNPPNEELPVPPEMATDQSEENLKFRALDLYHSQHGRDLSRDWMAGFIRASEAFYREQFSTPSDLAFSQ